MNLFKSKSIPSLEQRLQGFDTRRSAFEEAVNLYSPQLYRQIRRMVLSHDDANDILQNSLIKAWTNLEHFRGECKTSTWLYRITVNETLNFLNRQKDTCSLSDPNNSIETQLMADEYFDGDETELQLQQAMAQLPEKQRIVFQMKYYEEMKYDEMSIILNTSVGALKASYHHAVKKISDIFSLSD